MNFCSAKKRTLQSFVMKKADTANFCSQKKWTLGSLGGEHYTIVYWTLRNCITDITNYGHYKFECGRNPNVIARTRL